MSTVRAYTCAIFQGREREKGRACLVSQNTCVDLKVVRLMFTRFSGARLHLVCSCLLHRQSKPVFDMSVSIINCANFKHVVFILGHEVLIFL